MTAPFVPDFSDVDSGSSYRYTGAISPYVVRNWLDGISFGAADQVRGRVTAYRAGQNPFSPAAQDYVRAEQAKTDAEFDMYPGRALLANIVAGLPYDLVPALHGVQAAKAAGNVSKAKKVLTGAKAAARSGAAWNGAYAGMRALGEDLPTFVRDVGIGATAGAVLAPALAGALNAGGYTLRGVKALADEITSSPSVRDAINVLKNPNGLGSYDDVFDAIYGPAAVFRRPGSAAQRATSSGRDPNLAVGDIARGYMAGSNIPGRPMQHIDRVDEAYATHMAGVYDRLQSTPNDPKVREAYAALVAETKAQYDALSKAGYKIEFVTEDPYKSSADMMKDVRENKRLKVFKSPAGSHPVMTPEENDMFRAVHDLFGHAQRGNQFGKLGEERAYRDHSAMYSPLARRAMATETRGQNSWVNFGPRSAENRAKPGSVYADQKAALWPEDLLGEYSEMPPLMGR